MTTLEPEITSMAAPIVAQLRQHFQQGVARSYEWRLAQLQAIVKLLDDKEEELMTALMADSGKAEFTAYAGDIVFVRGEAKHAMKQLKQWMKPRKTATPIYLQPGKSYVRPEPLGVILIIGAWNFPIHLTLGPLVGAIAAGNTVLIKPSEVSPKVAAFLTKYVPQYLHTDSVKVLEGGIEETTDILAQRFDKILYTGNSHVAKIVSAAAAKHLTPVTLELGGKNPTVVRADANLAVSAHRIIESKFANNAGQVCVAPDYLLVHDTIYEEFLLLLKQAVVDFFGDHPIDSNVWSRIINPSHVQRLKKMLVSGETFHGGDVIEEENYIGPTLLINCRDDDPVMLEEIFGPILPVFSYKNDREAIKRINQREHPLALYIYTEDRQAANNILDACNSGGSCINACTIQAGNHNLPFGGVGYSGSQAYHGQYSFDNMSHLRAVIDKSTKVDPAGNYPPFKEKEIALRKKITRWLLSGT
ncbi:aldehyde dehydrogenase (NAD+) [Sinobacterium caligoides]|uniref:Aldehyde dehydrogenase n=1 Tax=Sinobacterium caligoides TaxID=933926 RepID=A0A3N2DMZ8_9GAMM|nr:aldehyde dehydrogenase family protein [Sinobacterium caligoides]ROS01186.1 aldehyde dehydrogenase (NAD+) [Sinobacterium caligoides]